MVGTKFDVNKLSTNARTSKTFCIMSKTVVGIFEIESDAQNAQNYLLANGFGDGDVDIKTASYKSGNDPSEESHDAEEGLFEKIGHFFRELLSDDHQQTERFVEAGKRGTIVTVHALSADEAIAAAHILDEYGAIDVTGTRNTMQPGAQYEDSILNPPSRSDGRPGMPDTVDARGPYMRSRIIDRPLAHEFRLRQQAYSTSADPGQPDLELNKTIAERDALLNEIVNNGNLKRP